MDWTSFLDSVKRGHRPHGKPLQDRPRLARVAVGMTAATITAFFFPETGQMLITVGAFLTAIACIMPNERSRLAASALTALGILLGAAAGIALQGRWWIVLPILFVAFFFAGLLRAITAPLSVRWLVVFIVFLALAEMGPTLPIDPLHTLGYFSLGTVIMFVCQFLPPFDGRYRAQRTAIAAFYRSIGTGAASSADALLAADRSLAQLGLRSRGRLDRLVQLTEYGEQIAQYCLVLEARPGGEEPLMEAMRDHLALIAGRIEDDTMTAVPGLPPFIAPATPADSTEQAFVAAVQAATALASGRDAPASSEERRVPTALELIRDELYPGSHILQHALRLAVTSVVAALVGLAVGANLDHDRMLAGHGFWVVVATALIVFPDFGSTFARGFGRMSGTLVGAAFGIALAFLPYNHISHGLILLALFFGYLAFRSLGQPYTMFWVVAFIAYLIPGPLGATTRGAATVIGCAIAFAAYLLFPTYQRRMLTRRLRTWALAAADKLDAIADLWHYDSAPHRRQLADATVRGRLARLDFREAAASALLEPKDKRGRWPGPDILPTVDSVTRLGADIAGLAALGPTFDDDRRREAADKSAQLALRFRHFADALAVAAREEGFTIAPSGYDPVASSDKDDDLEIGIRAIDTDLADLNARLSRIA
ncbi:MAG: FUSC family protein [Gordonia sp. (in: high G+C Gram-positive bacteria)]|uniref:FUSC family protein n=1 Tax=Gordonia sp. (in: high G+C Gram-positive bacteria) TaxID=84139 RepID=UPI0039E616F8